MTRLELKWQDIFMDWEEVHRTNIKVLYWEKILYALHQSKVNWLPYLEIKETVEQNDVNDLVKRHKTYKKIGSNE